MNFGLEGKRAAFVGLGADLEAACARVLLDEGVSVAVAGESSAPRADIVVAAGTDVPGRAVADVLGPDELSRAWDAVVLAVSAYRAALPAMLGRRWGRFVWIGTARAKALDAGDDEVGALVSLGMMGLHKVIGSEEGGHGVTANSVLRGGNATVDDVANTVAFFCSQGGAYLTGVTISVDGGAGSAVF